MVAVVRIVLLLCRTRPVIIFFVFFFDGVVFIVVPIVTGRSLCIASARFFLGFYSLPLQHLSPDVRTAEYVVVDRVVIVTVPVVLVRVRGKSKSTAEPVSVVIQLAQ